MSLPSTIPRIVYTGIGSQATYAWGWLVNAASDLHVAVLSNASPQVLTVLTLGADYTIQTPATQIGSSGGGNIVFTATGFLAPTSGNLPTGWGLVIRRAVAFGQPSVFNNQGAYDPASVESAFDYLAMQTLMLQDAVGRCVQMPLDDYAAPAQNVALAASRANQFLGFDSSGNPISVAAVTTAALTATGLGASLVQAATAGAALKVLGVFAPQQVLATSNDGGLTYTATVANGPVPRGTFIYFFPDTTNTAVALTFTMTFSDGTPSLATFILRRDGSAIHVGDVVFNLPNLLVFDGSFWRIFV